MAVALGFSILFSTFICLIMVPCTYIVGHQIKYAFKKPQLLSQPTQESRA